MCECSIFFMYPVSVSTPLMSRVYRVQRLMDVVLFAYDMTMIKLGHAGNCVTPRRGQIDKGPSRKCRGFRPSKLGIQRFRWLAVGGLVNNCLKKQLSYLRH